MGTGAFKYTFTVFTPTYNRVNLLPKAYDSLRDQTFCDFEWVIVDDGSTDGTGAIVREWSNEAPFPIHYTWQANRGKAVAINRGVEIERAVRKRRIARVVPHCAAVLRGVAAEHAVGDCYIATVVVGQGAAVPVWCRVARKHAVDEGGKSPGAA